MISKLFGAALLTAALSLLPTALTNVVYGVEHLFTAVR